MSYYIGVDIGTTSTKAIAFSAEGKIIAKENIGYEIHHPQSDRSEQNPDEILKAVISTLSLLLDKINAKPRCISFSAAMHSLIITDANGNALSPCIIWADNRSAAIASHLHDTPEGRSFYQYTGVPVHAMSPLCKLLWLKENDAALFKSAHQFLGIKEYVLFHLTGRFLTDSSIASATGLLNLQSLQWDQRILDYIGITSKQLPEIVSPLYTVQLNNTLFKNYHERLNDVPLVCGANDGGLANLGTGATGKEKIAITIGTSSAVRRVLPHTYVDDNMSTFCYHLYKDQYIIGGASNNGAIIFEWLRESILKTDLPPEELVKEAATIKPGCDGLVFIPYLLGERAPVWNAYAKGVFWGLNITHTRAHFIRAVMEGIIYSVYSIGEILLQQQGITEIYATGGFTQSELWLQMLCDMFNCTVKVSAAAESSALGAVIMGMEALQVNHNVEMETTAVYHPQKENHEIYLERFKQFKRIYSVTKD